MPHMSGKPSAAGLNVALERIRRQERIDASDDSVRTNTAADRLIAALVLNGR